MTLEKKKHFYTWCAGLIVHALLTEYNYSYIIYLDRGRPPKREKYGKTSGWEEVHKRVIKDLGRIPTCRRGISGKTPVCEQKHQLIHKDSVRIPAWERENFRLNKGNIFPSRKSLVSDIPAGEGKTAKPFFTV